MVGMDLHWRRARMRKWIAIGDQEGLTQREIARRAGVCTRTVMRWCASVRVQQATDPFVLLSQQVRECDEARAAAPAEPPALERAFVEIVEPTKPLSNPIHILLAGDRRRVLVDGAVDAEALVRILAAVERC